MSGPNTTGLPSTDDYNLGRGILYFAELDADGNPLAWRDLGNSPEFNLSTTAEELKHQSSRSGLRVVDKVITISQEVGVKFQLDEVNDENMAMIFSGEKATHTNVTIAGFTSYQMIQSVMLGRWYDIVNSLGERAYDVDPDDLTVNNDATSTDLVENTDYTLDSEMGRIFFKSTATGVDADDAIHVALTARALASTVSEVRALTVSAVEGALKFIGENPANDDQRIEYQIHKIRLRSDGDVALIGDDWTKMPFTGTAEENTGVDADSPTMTIRTVDAPTANG